MNDPLHGFITIPNDLVFDLIEHPWFQRLRRIQQLGLTCLVYPGATHTRFHHALGAMHLMSLSIDVLRGKGFDITPDEANGALVAILLHDIGHGPFSHALENCIIQGVNHEEISSVFFRRLNEAFRSSLETANAIFNDTYPKTFLHQLVSSQLDTDRLDYLMRDSFYTGVSEGVVNTDRILKMLTIAGDSLAVESKGIYSIEKFIVARRLMYWQVYFHKTVLAAEYLLMSILSRAKYLASIGSTLFATPAFDFLLKNRITYQGLLENREVLDNFAQLDDADIMASIKAWTTHPDKALSILCTSLVNRRLFRVIISNDHFGEEEINRIEKRVAKAFGLSIPDSRFFVTSGTITNNAYIPGVDRINILEKNGRVLDITDMSPQLNIGVYSEPVSRYFIVFPKEAEE